MSNSQPIVGSKIKGIRESKNLSVEEIAERSGLSVEVINREDPLYIEDGSELIEILSGAYESVTGEKPTLYTTGGGTYARKLKGRGVAFGPHFPGDPINMHNADESVDKENYFKHAQICLEAMYRLFTK